MLDPAGETLKAIYYKHSGCNQGPYFYRGSNPEVCEPITQYYVWVRG
jgi:hypothetical protein